MRGIKVTVYTGLCERQKIGDKRAYFLAIV